MHIYFNRYNYNCPKHSSSRSKPKLFKKYIKNYVPFTNCISEINNTQIDNAKDIDIVMPM